MIVAVFRVRMKADVVQAEYGQLLARLSKLAMSIPGYVSHKGFVAQDEERVVIVEYENEEALRAWSAHPEHVEAKKKGRQTFYSEYRVQVCEVKRDSRFPG